MVPSYFIYLWFLLVLYIYGSFLFYIFMVPSYFIYLWFTKVVSLFLSFPFQSLCYLQTTVKANSAYTAHYIGLEVTKALLSIKQTTH